MMRSIRILIITISCLHIISAKQAYGIPLYIPFEKKVQMSDLIVEGIVGIQTDNPDYERSNINSYRKKTLLEITKVYKGDKSVGDQITLFSHMNFVCDTSGKIVKGKPYLLMLEKHESGYADVNTGNGIWEIVTLKPNQKYLVQGITYRKGARSYEKFEEDLTWALSKRTVWPDKPAVSLEKAIKIAENTLSQTNINLKEYKLTKSYHRYANNDIVGVAHVDDPIWYLQWDKTKEKGQKGSPKRDSVACWIHAHTGNIWTSNIRPEIVSPQTSCCLFLKTNRILSDRYGKFADDIRVTQLTEETFENVSSLWIEAFLPTQSPYPEGTTFWRIDYPDSVDIKPVIIVLDKNNWIKNAGIIDSET